MHIITFLNFIHHIITYISSCMVHLCSFYAQFILNLLSFLILHMGPLLVCMYRARDYGVVGAAKPFPTQTIVQPDLTRVGTTQATCSPSYFSSCRVILDLIILIRFREHASCFNHHNIAFINNIP